MLAHPPPQPAISSSAARSGCELGRAGRPTSRPASLLRTLAARSLRCCGERALNQLGMRIRSIGSTGIGKSASDSRLTCRPAVSTSGSGALAASARGLPRLPEPWATPDRGRPRRRPGGRRAPGSCRPAQPLQRRPGLGPPLAERSASAAFSRSDSSLRSAWYSAKSPASQLTLQVVQGLRLRRSCRATPTTARSAWNWANDDSSSGRAPCPAHLADQVDRHVVGGPEAGGELVGPGARQARHGSGSMPGCQITTACPSTSMPRRPARPVSCVYSPGVRFACVSPFHLSSRSITTVRAGMLIAQGQRFGGEHRPDQPASNSSSTTSLKAGSRPA